MEKLHVFQLDDGEQHWYVGKSEDEVRQFHFGTWGEDYEEETCVYEIDDDQELLITMIDEVDQPRVKKSCREWADGVEKNYGKHGVALIASTCY